MTDVVTHAMWSGFFAGVIAYLVVSSSTPEPDSRREPRIERRKDRRDERRDDE